MSKVNDPTGKYRYRTNWCGKLILQVEIHMEKHHCEGMDISYYTEWRDAKVSDLQVIDTKPRVNVSNES